MRYPFSRNNHAASHAQALHSTAQYACSFKCSTSLWRQHLSHMHVSSMAAGTTKICMPGSNMRSMFCSEQAPYSQLISSSLNMCPQHNPSEGCIITRQGCTAAYLIVVYRAYTCNPLPDQFTHHTSECSPHQTAPQSPTSSAGMRQGVSQCCTEQQNADDRPPLKH